MEMRIDHIKIYVGRIIERIQRINDDNIRRMDPSSYSIGRTERIQRHPTDGRTDTRQRTDRPNLLQRCVCRISKRIDRIDAGIGRIIERIKRIIGVSSYPKNTRENTQYAY